MKAEVIAHNQWGRVTQQENTLVIHTYGPWTRVFQFLIIPLIVFGFLFFSIGYSESSLLHNNALTIGIVYAIALVCILLPRRIYRGPIPTDIVSEWNPSGKNIRTVYGTFTGAEPVSFTQIQVSLTNRLRRYRHGGGGNYIQWTFSCTFNENTTLLLSSIDEKEVLAVQHALQNIGVTVQAQNETK
ncbi:MAG: hypothetical protein AAB473_01275 [Patescibacteria group bacterium]